MNLKQILSSLKMYRLIKLYCVLILKQKKKFLSNTEKT